jgi:putative colanic acid biosynthesis acetyltransferase WcaF
MQVRLAEFSNKDLSRGRSLPVELLWLVVQAAFVSSWLPGSFHRCFLLRMFGARIGKGVNIKPRVRVKFPWRLEVGDHTWIGEEVWIDDLDEVRIGSNCCLSQAAYLCTGSHDWTKPAFDLLTGPIRIQDGAWIAARASVGPGVTVGEGAVLTFGSVATKNLPPWTINSGVPASVTGSRRIGSAA